MQNKLFHPFFPFTKALPETNYTTSVIAHVNHGDWEGTSSAMLKKK